MEVVHSTEPTMKSHALVDEHDESLVPRDKEDDPRRTAGQGLDHQSVQLGAWAALDAGTNIW